MGRGFDTDWAEARDSREDELSRLKRLGSSVESEHKRKEMMKNVIRDKHRIKTGC